MMISQKFINRTRELNLLQNSCDRDRAFIIVYGRRRVGKTRLLQEFVSEKNGFYFTFANTHKGVQLQEFQSRASEFLKDSLISTIQGDWYDTFRFFFHLIDDTTIIVLDEFTYAIKADRKILSDLQRLWDTDLRDRPVKLIICGSLLGMVKDEILAYTSPLYGRRTRELHVTPFRYNDALKFFDDPDHGLNSYMITGGFPEYLLVAQEYEDTQSFIESEFLHVDGYFYREPYFILSQDLKDIKTYFAILNAIAYGKTKPAEISHFVNVDTRIIYPYLENLQRLDIIYRETSLGGDHKRGIYKLADRFIHSWFNIVYKKRYEIENGTASISDEELNTILGSAFESLGMEFLIDRNVKEDWGISRFGRWWHKGNEIDIVGINEQSKNVIAVECKYRDLDVRDVRRIISSLEKKIERTPWNSPDWNVQLGVIAKSISGSDELTESRYICFDRGDILQQTP